MDPKIERRLKRAMKVEDLIAELKELPPEAIVGFASDYGDYSHTTQFLTVTEVRELDPREEEITGTAYSHSELAISEKRDDDEPDEDELAELSAEERKEYEDGLKKDAEYKFVVLS